MKRERERGKKTNRKTCAQFEKYYCIENKNPNDTDGGWSGFRSLNVDLIASNSVLSFFVQ
jgi:hypothetical protein